MSHHAAHTADDDGLMSLAEAARITGQPKAYLRELVAAGRLAVYLTGDPAAPKWRVDRPALEAAGLLVSRAPAPSAADAAVAELIALVKAQTTRIAALEDQRFHLAAQLGATVERIAAVEVRTASDPTRPALPATSGGPRQSTAAGGLRRTVEVAAAAGVRRSAGLGARLLGARGRNHRRPDEEPAG